MFLATCSYSQFTPDMGVPVGTSVGKHRGFPHAEQVDALKPWTTFRKMSDRPLSEQRDRYQRQLTDTEQRVSRALHDLTARYPGHRLVLLCWCDLSRPDTGPNGCHRRWAADWLEQRGLTVPELAPPAPTLWD